jgi:hypothetical protein
MPSRIMAPESLATECSMDALVVVDEQTAQIDEGLAALDFEKLQGARQGVGRATSQLP